MMSSPEVTIIGAGPVGLFAAFMCGTMGLKSRLIDALPQPGGQCSALYPEKPIYDIPGLPGVKAQTLIDHLLEQIRPFHPEFVLNARVTHLEKEEALWQHTHRPLWSISTPQGDFSSPIVILSSGIGAFQPKKPMIDGIEKFEGKSVFYHVKEVERFRGKDIVLAGGGDSCVDWANLLCDVAASVTLVHRRSTFRAQPEGLRQLKHRVDKQDIVLKEPFVVHGLIPGREEGSLSQVSLRSLKDQEILTVPAHYFLAFFGVDTDAQAQNAWGLDLEDKKIKVHPGTCATNLEGVYGVGDAVSYEHKLKLILTGFSEGAQAAHHIRSYLFPDRTFPFQYSTTALKDKFQ